MKKAVSALLVVFMLTAIIPVAVYASEGSCGEGASWSFDESMGTLIIKGTGEIERYYNDSDVFAGIKDSIVTVVIEKGITSIGYEMFSEMPALTKVVIPSTVESIGNYAFYGSINLKHVAVPNGVEFIGNLAFANTGIESLRIPASVLSIGIGNGVAPYLSSITTDSENKGGYYSIDGVLYQSKCYDIDTEGLMEYLLSLSEEEQQQIIESISAGDMDVVYELQQRFGKFRREVAIYPCGKAVDTYVIPWGTEAVAAGAFLYAPINNVIFADQIRVVEYEAFAGSWVRSVKLNDGLEEISDYAFYYCSNLSDINLPDTLKKSGEYVFDGTMWYETVKNDPVIYLGDYLYKWNQDSSSAEIKEGTKGIFGGAFQALGNLETIVIPDSVKYVSDFAIGGCENLKYIKLGQGIEYINSDTLLFEALSEIDVGKCQADIDFKFLNYTDNSVKVSVDPSNEKYVLHEGVLYKKLGYDHDALCEYTRDMDEERFIIFILFITDEKKAEMFPVSSDSDPQYTFLAHVSGKIGNEFAFMDGTVCMDTALPDNVKSLIFPQSMKYIETALFSGSSLTQLVIPSSVKSIGMNAFSLCMNLASVEISEGVEYIGKGAFASCEALMEVTIPKSVTHIGEYAFGYTLDYSGESIAYVKQDGFVIKGAYDSAAEIYALENGFEFIGEQEVIPGDINGNGEVRSNDVTFLKRYFAGYDIEINVANSDVNGDGRVNGFDMIALKRMIVT